MYTLIAFLWVWHSDEKGKDKEDSIQMSWKSMIFFFKAWYNKSLIFLADESSLSTNPKWKWKLFSYVWVFVTP